MLMQLWIRINELRNREEGQALVEYALILALVSVAAIVVLGLLGLDVRDAINGVEDQILGNDG